MCRLEFPMVRSLLVLYFCLYVIVDAVSSSGDNKAQLHLLSITVKSQFLGTGGRNQEPYV